MSSGDCLQLDLGLHVHAQGNCWGLTAVKYPLCTSIHLHMPVLMLEGTFSQVFT